VQGRATSAVRDLIAATAPLSDHRGILRRFAKRRQRHVVVIVGGGPGTAHLSGVRESHRFFFSDTMWRGSRCFNSARQAGSALGVALFASLVANAFMPGTREALALSLSPFSSARGAVTMRTKDSIRGFCLAAIA
jgi:hypothetical protein